MGASAAFVSAIRLPLGEKTVSCENVALAPAPSESGHERPAPLSSSEVQVQVLSNGSWSPIRRQTSP